MKLEFSWQFFEKSSNINFYENPPGGSRDVLCGRTDIIRGKDNNRFLQFLGTRLEKETDKEMSHTLTQARARTCTGSLCALYSVISLMWIREWLSDTCLVCTVCVLGAPGEDTVLGSTLRTIVTTTYVEMTTFPCPSVSDWNVCRIFVKLGIAVLHKNLLNVDEFCENRFNDSHTSHSGEHVQSCPVPGDSVSAVYRGPKKTWKLNK
jgi:hypothetical protein